MQEYFDEAIVLSKEPSGEADIEVALFTKGAGKLFARAKSARKITSKLSAHLEPGNHIQVRLVEKSGFNVADALTLKKLSLTPADLHFLEQFVVENEPDAALWKALLRDKFSWPEALALFGWDPTEAVCRKCGRAHPEYFYLKTQEFFCEQCAHALRIPGKELLYISGGEH